MPHTIIAERLGVDAKTLRKHYREELDNGLESANAMVAQSLFKTATSGTGSGAVTAAIFWLKTRAGWREVQRVEHGVEDTLRALLRDIADKNTGLPHDNP
jgi:hypothetical protein